MSERHWTIHVCPECGEPVSEGCDRPMLPARGHYHDNPASKFLKRIFHPAEEITVVREPHLPVEDCERLLKLADIIGGVHKPCADPELHEDDARFLRNLASAPSGGEQRLAAAVRETLCDDSPCARCDHLRAALSDQGTGGPE